MPRTENQYPGLVKQRTERKNLFSRITGLSGKVQSFLTLLLLPFRWLEIRHWTRIFTSSFQYSSWSKKLNRIFHTYQLDRLLGGIFHFYSNSNRIFCKQTVVRPIKLDYAAPIRSPYSKLQTAGDGETRVVSAKCSMSLNGHLYQSSLLLFTRFIVKQCLLKKTSIWPLLTVRKLPGHHL